VARPIGEKIAAIARRELGNGACGPNTVDGGDYGDSCKNHHAAEPWCADFAKWVWCQAKVLHTGKLNAAAASFAAYGHAYSKVRHRNPKVGDAVVFGLNKKGDSAAHVAIVVRVLPGGKTVSIGGNEGPSDDTSKVSRDGPYDGTFDSFGVGAPNGPISGYISPVEDDMPFTKNEIRSLVQEGVAAAVKKDVPTQKEIVKLVKQAVQAELTTALDSTGTTAAKGAKAAVDADAALSGIITQLDNLKTQVAALMPATAPTTSTGTTTGTGRGDGTKTGTGTSRGTRAGSGTRASGSATTSPSP
jgi:CHAP domain